VRSAGARLRAALARCRSALVQARTAARHGGHDAVAAGHTDAAGRALGAKLSLVSERLEEAHRAMDEVAAIASALADALERERATVKIKDLLLREADRRIRNSLQGLASLLRLQAARSERPEAAEALRLGSARVGAVGEVQGMLRGDPDGAVRLDLDVYLRGLCASLAESLGADGRSGGELVVEVEPAAVEAAAAQALGLAVGELVANAFRHAFEPGVPGTVWVQGAPDGSGGYRLVVADDGRGLPGGFALGSGRGFGLRLVSLLAARVGAGFQVHDGRGARFVLTVPTPTASRTAR
jgi:two-component sensor histidine kinase